MKHLISRNLNIEVTRLHPHPEAAKFWDGQDKDGLAEDLSIISQSIAKDGGVRRPLLVTDLPDGKGYWVLDGCARLAGALAAGLPTVPCDICEIAEEDIPMEVFVLNMERRRFNSSQRIMAYIEANKGAALAAAEANENPEESGARGGHAKARGGHLTTPSREGSNFGSEKMSERLGVSDKDVRKAVLLARCHTQGKWPVYSELGNAFTLRAATEEESEKVAEMYAKVVSGVTPVRTWVPGLKGLQLKGKPRERINFGPLALRAITSLQTAFGAWQEIDHISREGILSALQDALDQAPEDVLHLLATRYARPEDKGKKGKRA
jgi:hypothetical protein